MVVLLRITTGGSSAQLCADFLCSPQPAERARSSSREAQRGGPQARGEGSARTNIQGNRGGGEEGGRGRAKAQRRRWVPV